MKDVVIDFDDVYLDSPASNRMDWLFYYKGKYPNFRVNLFAIPGKSTWDWLDEIDKLDWISLCMHGWNHDEEESLTEEMFLEWSYSWVYKGPNWKADKDEIDLLRNYGFVLAVKEKVDHSVKQWPLTDPRCLHGHIWVEDDLKRIEKHFEKDTEFHFIREVI
jgi:hypothetical protein